MSCTKLNLKLNYVHSILRCGILKLKIETGRFNNTLLENRICDLCETGLIEDELHLICVCSKFERECQEFYITLTENYPNFNQIIQIFLIT